MSGAYVMIVLTLISGNGLSAAFSNAPNKPACEKVSGIVGKILVNASYRIEKIGCFVTSHSFSPYEHGTPQDAPHGIFLIRFQAGRVHVTVEDDRRSCMSAREKFLKASAGSAYCATSTQTLIR